MTSNGFSLLRLIMLGATGLVCLAYAILAFTMGRPDPMNPYIPGIMGGLAFLALTVGGIAAGPQNAGAANDEGYRNDNKRAAAFGYWVAIWLYPIFAVLMINGYVQSGVAFATMGTLTAAAFLLRFVQLDVQGRL